MSQKMAIRCPLIIDLMITSKPTVVHHVNTNVLDDPHSDVDEEAEADEVDEEAEPAEADELPPSER